MTSEDDPLPVSVLGSADGQTVDGHGRRASTGIDGVELQLVRAHLDSRGSLAEVINFADPFWREPIVYSYSLTIEPGRIKGWGMHLRQADRHHVHCGRLRIVLHDARTNSPTHGNTAVHCLGSEARGALRIPPGVWHAFQNVGQDVVHVTNFPTIAYDHEHPDKQMLPLDTELISFDFDDLDSYGR